MLRPSFDTAVCVSALAVLLAGCGPLEIKVSKNEGVRPVRGSLEATLVRVDEGGGIQEFVCGDTITGTDDLQTYTVTSHPVAGGCKFEFDQDVEILRGDDYEQIKMWTNDLRYVRRVELTLNQFDFFDENGNRFEVETRLRDAELILNGTQILDIEAIGHLPKTVRIEGEALKAIKRAAFNREACSVHITASLTILDEHKPKKLRCDYDAQPTYVLSLTEL